MKCNKKKLHAVSAKHIHLYIHVNTCRGLEVFIFMLTANKEIHLQHSSVFVVYCIFRGGGITPKVLITLFVTAQRGLFIPRESWKILE